MKILEQLWYGNILPHERDVSPKSRLERLGRLIVRNEEELDPLLSEKAKEVFEKLMENQADRTRLNECEAFAMPLYPVESGRIQYPVFLAAQRIHENQRNGVEWSRSR